MQHIDQDVWEALKAKGPEALGDIALAIKAWAREQIPGEFLVAAEYTPDLPIGQVIAVATWLGRLAEEMWEVSNESDIRVPADSGGAVVGGPTNGG